MLLLGLYERSVGMKKNITRIAAAVLLFVAGLLIGNHFSPLSPVLLAAACITSGADVIFKAFRNILRGKIFDENFLMSVAAVCAFIIGEYPEAAAVMIFYQVGETFQHYAVGKSRKSISALMEICPEYANLKVGDELQKVPPESVNVGDIVVIRPGEKIPLDAVVIDGASSVDCSPLTGEPIPKDVSVGCEVLSGCINLSGVLTVKTTGEYGKSAVSKILELVEDSMSKKSRSENFITKFAQIYTPAVTVCAVLLALIPPLLFNAPWSVWVYRALSFLVVSCPCALVISAPLGFFGGIGAASKSGILIKGGRYIENLASAQKVVFDKTGTLTTGSFKVCEIHTAGISEEELLFFAAHAESASPHPISKAILEAYGKEIDTSIVKDIQDIAGYGVLAAVKANAITVGSIKLMKLHGISVPKQTLLGAVAYVAIDNTYAGTIVVSDRLKPESEKAITDLKRIGIKHVAILTGDNRLSAEKTTETLGVDGIFSELLPEDKVCKLEEIMSSSRSSTIFVGDGINDAPALARADVGIAMGALGSDAAIESADVVIVKDSPADVAAAIRISRRTMRIVKQNVVFSLSVKLLALTLSSLGIFTMWFAVFADVGVSVLAILNSFRTLNFKNK